jgi:hypothetical protein
LSSDPISTVSQVAAAATIALVPFVVERISVSPRGSVNSAGELPRSNSRRFRPPRSPAVTAPGRSAFSRSASSISTVQSTRS